MCYVICNKQLQYRNVKGMCLHRIVCPRESTDMFIYTVKCPAQRISWLPNLSRRLIKMLIKKDKFQ